MKVDELFSNDVALLKNANLAVAMLTKKINEAAKSAPQTVGVLKDKRSRLLEGIQQHTLGLLLEDYMNDLKTLLVDIIVSTKARNVDSIPLKAVEKELSQQGFDIDRESLINALVSVEGVVRVASDVIELDVDKQDRAVSDDQAEKDKDKIEKTAKKVAKDKLKNKNKVPSVEIK